MQLIHIKSNLKFKKKIILMVFLFVKQRMRSNQKLLVKTVSIEKTIINLFVKLNKTRQEKMITLGYLRIIIRFNI